MKGAEMYHKIKTMRIKYSVRYTAKLLKISTGSVQKYSQMGLEEASSYLKRQKRRSQFDEARNFIEEKLEEFPNITATKLLRQVKAEYPNIKAKVRSFRNYIRSIRVKYRNKKSRNYHPVFNDILDGQVQVDPGECNISIDSSGSKMKVYFVSFVFSYSRIMYAHFQNRPYKTEDFIRAHLEAFRYFGGVAKEYVYDQTKLVVIKEKYREVWLNRRFQQFALKYEFLPIVCEGYDPESKGKVERSVRYIKEDFLYGDHFSDIESVRKASLVWLDKVANNRIHATTKRKPSEMFLEEKPFLNTRYYIKDIQNHRLVDKTGLISFEGNKYSVPILYQKKEVLIDKEKSILFIRDLESGKEIAKHSIPEVKGEFILNRNHYRDIRKSVAEITSEVSSLLSDINGHEKLIAKIKTDNPRIVRDQLKGLKELVIRYPSNYWNEAIPYLLSLPQIRTSIVAKILLSVNRKHQLNKIREMDSYNDKSVPKSSTLDRSLEFYMKGVKNVK
ncbi:MAG: IS21 family transposase [Deltaproteobacteria bacterium]|nr:MAG: IS21 family transposase [Deltaproteobacteria bacterium]